MAEGVERSEWIEEGGGDATKEVKKIKRKGIAPEKAREEREQLQAARRVAVAKRLRWRLRYFSPAWNIRGRIDAVLRGIHPVTVR